MSPAFSELAKGEDFPLAQSVFATYRPYFLYCIFGLLWIALSDRSLVWLQLSEDIVDLTVFQTVKGWLFVGVSTALFLRLSRGYIQRVLDERHNTHLFADMMRSTYDIAWKTDRDGTGMQVVFNRAGVIGGDVERTFDLQNVHPDDRAETELLWRNALQGREGFTSTARLLVDGDYRYFQYRVIPVFDRFNRLVEWFGALNDIDELMRSRVALQRNEELLRLAADAGEIGIWDWDVPADRVTVSEKWRELFGRAIRAPAELKSIIHADDYPMVRSQMRRAVEGCGPYDIEYRIRCASRGQRWIRSRGSGLNEAADGARRVVGVSLDITQRKHSEARLRELAYEDPTTGLPNRRSAEQFIRRAIANARLPRARIGLCAIDIDHFSAINESRGHRIGDLLLQRVAERFEAALKPGEQVSRHSADIFLLALSGVGDTEAIEGRVAEVLALFDRPFDVDGHEIFLRVSSGLAIYDDDVETAEDLILAAEAAQRDAKTSSRGHCQRFDPTMRAEVARWEEIRCGLQAAVRNDELSVHYQPQYDIRSESLAGFEALVRWDSATLGRVSPGEFMPVAEQTGLIYEISDFVLRSVVDQIERCQAEGRSMAPIAVNLSPVCLENRECILAIEKFLGETRIDPSNIVFEVTETAIMRSVDRVREVLSTLSDMGFQIAIDDFGTGHSSLENLLRFHIDKIKIDVNFIRQIMTSDTHAGMALSIIQMGHELGFEVIAEGVETAEQACALKGWGCDVLQGYYYARPVPVEEAASFVESEAVKLDLAPLSCKFCAEHHGPAVSTVRKA